MQVRAALQKTAHVSSVVLFWVWLVGLVLDFFFLNPLANWRTWKEETPGPERSFPTDYSTFQADEIGILKLQLGPP